MLHEEEAGVETLRDETELAKRNAQHKYKHSFRTRALCENQKRRQKRVRRRWYKGRVGGGGWVGDGVESEQSQTWLVTDDCAGGTKIGMGKRNITC